VPWQRRLDLDDYEIRHERVPLRGLRQALPSRQQLGRDRADHERREAVVFHTRRLRAADIVHELLHLRHPEWSERVAKNGKTVVNHALRATDNETNLTKFVSRDDWERIDAPEE
jgi:hypothetical protein